VPTAPGKTRITIRLDNDVIEHFQNIVDRAGGGNYQTMINAALREYIQGARLEAVVRRAVRKEVEAIRAHASSSAAARPAKKQNRGESLAAIQLELALEARRGSGATTTSVPVMQNAGAVPDPTKTIQKQAFGAKIIYLSEYKQKEFGHGEGDLPKMGVY
jgi:metal-responsive CopG/Arc/MetJ family transcriptional regulator